MVFVCPLHGQLDNFCACYSDCVRCIAEQANRDYVPSVGTPLPILGNKQEKGTAK